MNKEQSHGEIPPKETIDKLNKLKIEGKEFPMPENTKQETVIFESMKLTPRIWFRGKYYFE